MSQSREEDDLVSDHIKPLLRRMKHFSLLEPFPDSWFDWEKVNLNNDFTNHEYLQITLILSPLTSPVRMEEKTHWAFGFAFEDIPCVITLQTFGLRLYIGNNGDLVGLENPESLDELVRGTLNVELQTRLVIELRNAVAYVEKKFISALFKEVSESDSLVLRNDYHSIRNMYLYFRDAAVKYSEKRIAQNLESHEGTSATNRQPVSSITEILAPWFEERERFRNKGYYEFAAVLSFFSLIEHVLILLLSLSPAAFDRSINEFLKMSLKDKLNLVSIKGDRESLVMRSKLLDVAEKYRNFFAHGGIAKGGRSTHIYIKGVGPIANPAFKRNRDPSLPFIEFLSDEPNVDSEVFPFFDEFETWLAKGSARFGMKFIDEGLDIVYDKKFLERFLDACSDEVTFDDWLRERSLAIDRMINFGSL